MEAERISRVGPNVAEWIPPIIWTVFALFFVVVASQVFQGSFYLAVRGTGIVQYPSAIVIFSRSSDRNLLFYIGAVVLLLHALLQRKKGKSDALALSSLIALALALVGYMLFNEAFIGIVGISALFLILEGSSRVGTGSSETITRLFATLLGVLFIFSLLAVSRWVAGGFDGSVPLGDPSWSVATTTLQFVGLLYSVLPELVLLFFFSWALRLALASELSSFRLERDEEREIPAQMESKPQKKIGWTPLAVLGLGTMVAVFVGAYPYLSAVNPSSMLVGVDVRDCYAYWLKGIPGSRVCGPVGFTIGNERIGALWLLQGLTQLLGSPDAALKVAPSVLGVLLVLATFILVREGTGDDFVAAVSGLFTAVSTQVVAAIDSGTLANWLGMSIAYLFFALVLRGMKTRKLLYLFPAFGLFSALLFIHPWTWAVVLSVLSVFLVVELVQSAAARRLRTKRFELVLGGTLVVLGLGVDLAKSGLPSGSGLAVAIMTALPSLNPANVFQVAPNLEQSLIQYLGGAQADPIWFVVGVVGVLAIADLRGRFSKLLLVWIFGISLGVILAGPPPHLLQSRIIYQAPLQIFGAFGVVALINRITRGVSRRLSGLIMALGIATILLLALGFALDYVGFLYQ